MATTEVRARGFERRYTALVPIYEYACHGCRKFVEIITRRVPDDSYVAACPECGSKQLTRMVSTFAFHLSMQSKIDQLDPKYDKMIDASSPDLSFDNLVKKYRLDTPMSTPAERKAFREAGNPKLVDDSKPARPAKTPDFLP
jgi:putative FmdB family regulatory protein